MYATIKNKLTIIDCNNDIQNEINIIKCKLINSISITNNNNYDCSTHTRRCIAKNVSLSNHIKNEIKASKKQNFLNGRYDIIFRCGGYANYTEDKTCNAFIINQLKINEQSKDEV